MQKLKLDNGQLDPFVSKPRVLLLHVVIILLILGHFFDLAFDKEHWPFSQYPMYSRLQSEYSYSGLRLYGVTQEEPHREIPLRSSDYIGPFIPFRLETAMSQISSKEDPELLNKALLDTLSRYEKLRLAGRHEGPPLQSVRLYEQQWQLAARAENVDWPDNRKLIAEVEQP